MCLFAKNCRFWYDFVIIRFRRDLVEEEIDLKEKSKSDNSEKVLIIAALVMFAVLIGYNAFFIPPISENIQISGDIIKDQETSGENSESSKNKTGLININTASKEELTELTGVGPKIAERIIEYRKTHGGFSSKEEIMNVKGIGEKIFEKFKDDITVKQ